MTTQAQHLIPYVETKVIWLDKAHGALEIQTPWIHVDAQVDVADVEAVQEAVDAVNAFDASSSSQRERMLSSYFLGQFEEYPIGYARPRSRADYGDVGTTSIPTVEPDVSTAFADLFASSIWPVAGVLGDSRIVKTNWFDAVTAIGLMRRLRLVATSANAAAQNQVAALYEWKRQDPGLFVRIMRRILEHSLYVTTEAVPALSLALGRSSAADEVLESFIASEKGHDLLVRKSLMALGGVREHWKTSLLAEVRSLVELLRLAARTSHLALAALIEGFEGVRYDEEPNNLWNLLVDIPGHSTAASGVREHQRINDRHYHANTCLDLAAKLPPATEAEVVLALRFCEAAETLRTRLFAQLYSSVGLE